MRLLSRERGVQGGDPREEEVQTGPWLWKAMVRDRKYKPENACYLNLMSNIPSVRLALSNDPPR